MVASAVRVFTYTLALTLLLLCQKRGQITSGPLFIFWLLEAVFGAVTFRFCSSIFHVTSTLHYQFQWHTTTA